MTFLLPLHVTWTGQPGKVARGRGFVIWRLAAGGGKAGRIRGEVDLAGTAECLHARFSNLSAASGALRSGVSLPCPGPRSVPWRLCAAQDRACSCDAIEPPKRG
ncbi:MAG: hypothetical protein E6Q06_05015 [Candidatus Moraniibacteriota bacterium]|nr:MAG: hypothetical protein E6Q06_05015 [Candidatus Moranbacteria bacterium]